MFLLRVPPRAALTTSEGNFSGVLRVETETRPRVNKTSRSLTFLARQLDFFEQSRLAKENL